MIILAIFGQISDLHFLTIFGKNRKKTAVKSDQKLKKKKKNEIWPFWGIFKFSKSNFFVIFGFPSRNFFFLKAKILLSYQKKFWADSINRKEDMS